MPSRFPSPRIWSGDSPLVTSGLVVTLDPGSTESDSALAAIRTTPEFSPGVRTGWQLPVALESDGAESSERWCDWLRALPGVIGVEVVFVHWDEVEHGAG
jgi:hypothetical protein